MNEQDETTVKKRGILKKIFGDLPLPEILEINSKLKFFDKIINNCFYVFLFVSFLTYEFLGVRVYGSKIVYLIMTVPIVVLVSLCLIIIFRKKFGVNRLICIGWTAVMMYLSNQWIDLYSFIKQDYLVTEGVPSKVEKLEPRYGKRCWEVVINDVKFSLPLKLKKKQIKSGLVIQYLPHSKFIIKYKTKDNK